MDFLILALLIICFIIGLISSFYQYIQHRQLEKQKSILSLNQKIKETEQILEHAVALSLSKALLNILEKRILRLLQQINAIKPQDETLDRVKAQTIKIKAMPNDKIALSYFVLPSNRNTAVLLLQNYRVLKRLLRDELAINQIDLPFFRKEMSQISYYCDLIIVREKIQNIASLLKQDQIEQASYLFGIIQQEPANQQLLDTYFQDDKIQIENTILHSLQNR
jgi:hypothetical protein